MTTTQRVTTAIRFPSEVHERLRAEADRLDRSLNWVVNDIVKRHLDAMPADPDAVLVVR